MPFFNGTNNVSDTITGGAGDDTIYGYDSASASLGGITDNDSLSGAAGNDLIDGGEGNDTLDGGDGADSLFGGDQNDLINTGGNTTFGNDSAFGGNGNDTIIGGSGNILLYGDAGADFINMSGADAVSQHFAFGGDGNDTISGSAGADYMDGGPGADVINAGAGDDAVNSLDAQGPDTLDGGAGIDSLALSRSSAVVAISANFSNPAALQTLSDGTTVVNFERIGFSAGAGNDTITASNGANGQADNYVYGGDGADSLTAASNGALLVGDAGNDTLTGGAGNDQLDGGLGDDLIVAGAALDGLDGYNGGAGADTVDYSALGAANGLAVTLNGAVAATVIVTGGNNDQLLNVENVTGGAGNDSITGDTLTNTLTGGAGNDTLNGAGGDDLFVASGALDGSDSLVGGLGSDTADYSALGAVNNIAVTISATATVIVTGGNNDQLSGVENVTGGAGNDFIKGDANANILTGGLGADALIGGGGADTLDAGAGNDFLYIDHLDTSLNGGAAYDALYVQDATGTNVNVGAAQTEYNYAWLGNDTLDASTASVGVALIGEAGADSLTGSAFNDYIYFDAADTINAGAGYDALFYYQGTGQALANLNLNVAATNAEYVIGGGGNDALFNTGSSTAVALIGGAGADTLTGGLGNDYLYGDSGAGNLGADVFVVTLGAQTDTVLDFSNGADRLNVHNTGFTTFAQVQAAASASGASTIINFGGGNTMTLYNFALGNLDASDIIF